VTRPNRLRRSCLAVPATNERALAKAPTLDADMVFVDLEDAVPPAAKNDETRSRAAAALREHDWRPATLAVRINGIGTGWWRRDLEVLVAEAGARLDVVVVPKVESPEALASVDAALGQLEASSGRGPIGIEALIESARGLVEVERIAGASPRLEALVFGPADFAASLGVSQRSIGEIDPAYPGDQWHYARSRIAATAHAFGLQPIDGPYADVADLDGLEESARRARLLGFAGKWVVHPGQIATANAAFSPTEEELRHAREVLAALDEAADADGRGALLHDGAMIDAASRRLAEAVVHRGDAERMQT